ncbi:uncharacterized protein LOC127710184 isoform X2 [Mytilus californianus]|uniref:uncharacterized protein LOC127710184 isoform X1 n=1 Tax=Mytilus californianus TaxID=6549 RepID=UPI0022472C3C|nr:uncharacterized protein LOC127710184 isoform X1 [Mytilus californianus]XP_052071909.1 uncharacterized protein LOC127710184 isoform X2 [Mytilus californianus]
MNYANVIICTCFATSLMVQHGKSSNDTTTEPTTISTATEPTMATSTTAELTTTSTTTEPTTATVTPVTSASGSGDSGSASLVVNFYQMALCVCISIASSKRTRVISSGVLS